MRGSRTRGKRGLTIVEALIAGALLALFLGVVSSAVTSYLRAYRQIDETQPSFRSLAHGMEALGRTLSSSQSIESPSLDRLEAGHTPVWGETEPLTVVYLDPHGELKRSSFAYDETRGGVVQVDTELEAMDGNLIEGRLIARSVGFHVQLELPRSVPVLVFRLHPVNRDRAPLQSAVRLSTRVLASPGRTP